MLRELHDSLTAYHNANKLNDMGLVVDVKKFWDILDYGARNNPVGLRIDPSLGSRTFSGHNLSGLPILPTITRIHDTDSWPANQATSDPQARIAFQSDPRNLTFDGWDSWDHLRVPSTSAIMDDNWQIPVADFFGFMPQEADTDLIW